MIEGWGGGGWRGRRTLIDSGVGFYAVNDFLEVCSLEYKQFRLKCNFIGVLLDLENIYHKMLNVLSKQCE